MTAVGLLAAVIGILFLAYYGTKWIAVLNIRNGMPAGAGRHLQILEQLTVGKDQKLMTVRAGERYFLLGFSGSAVTVLAEFTAEEAAHWQTEKTDIGQNSVPGFGESFLAVLRKKKK